MHDKLRSYIRTIVPVALGHVAAVLVAWLATHAGVSVEAGLAYEVLAIACSAAVYVTGRRLETSDAAWLRGIGRFLLSLGADLGQPVYPHGDNSAPEPAAAAAGERVYNAYGQAVGWRTYSGGPMHPWSQLPGPVRAAWIQAGAAASRQAGAPQRHRTL